MVNWIPWDPDAYKTGRIEFMEEELNQLHQEKLKNEQKAKEEFDKQKDAKRKAIEENIKKAEWCSKVYYQWFTDLLRSKYIELKRRETKKMQEIASAIQIGAKAYLNRQYKTIAIVGVVVLVIISYAFSILVGLGYLIGAALSGIAGYVGMLVSVQANVRTAEASRKGLSAGL